MANKIKKKHLLCRDDFLKNTFKKIFQLKILQIK